MKNFAFPLIFALVCSTQAHAQAPASGPAARNLAQSQTDAKWPDASRASPRGGVFVSWSNVSLLRIGMTKSQLYPILDAPNFSEGFYVRHWNYLLNVPTGVGAEVKQCQLQIHFDRHSAVDAIFWKEKSCDELSSSHLKAW